MPGTGSGPGKGIEGRGRDILLRIYFHDTVSFGMPATDTNPWTVTLPPRGLRGRSFLLGNKRAFSLTLPAASGNSDVLLHAHKWFGAYHYGQKFLEAQVLRTYGGENRILGERSQTGFSLGLTTARREYEIDGQPLSEEFFVADGVKGFMCRLDGAVAVTVEPELDMRYSNALNRSTDGYAAEIEGGVLFVRAELPGGRYDDATESFIVDPSQTSSHLWAAIAVDGDDVWIEELPAAKRARRKLFSRDLHRSRLVEQSGPDAADHAPLWKQCSSRVYAPARLHVPAGGTVTYGFGDTREEALRELDTLRGNLLAFQVQKTDATRAILARAPLDTGSPDIDTAYVQVLTRLMDALVARQVTAGDTALDRPSTMILAGNQYFHDSWKRDENIALGFLLSLGYYDLARDVIRDTWQLQDPVTGRLPQRIRTGEEPPYHSSDGTLWALIRLYQYWRCSGDESLILDKLPMLEHFFRCSLDRVIDGMLPSGRTTHPDYLWETWMDTPHTPRDGFPIEIQLLWLVSLSCFRPVIKAHDPELEAAMGRAEEAGHQALERFNTGQFLADSLGADRSRRDLLTPNAFFAFGLGLDLDPGLEISMLQAGREHLAGSHGIRTLAPSHWDRVFSPEFLADTRNIRGKRMRSIGKYNYHRGVEWNWLAFFFVLGELKYGNADAAFRRYLLPQVRSVLTRDGIGGISELHDLSGARGPEYQAWSMAGFVEAVHAFAGVRVDVPDRTISLSPQLPSGWAHLDVRKWYGSIPFDVRFRVVDGAPRLDVDFPHGEVPDARINVSFVLPRGTELEHVDALFDSVPQSPGWHLDAIPGSSRRRVRVTVPAAEHLSISLGARKASAALTRAG